MRSKTIGILALLFGIAAGAGLYVNREDRIVGHDSVSPTTDANDSKISETVTGHAELDITPERSILVGSSPTPIFSDVPDSELDHQAIEGFIAARPIGAYRIVRVDSDALRTKIRQSTEIPEFGIQLLDSDPIPLTARVAKEHSSGWQSGFASWRGIVKGDDTSRASFTVSPDGSVNGVVRSLETGRIKIEVIKGTQNHIIWSFGQYDGPIENID